MEWPVETITMAVSKWERLKRCEEAMTALAGSPHDMLTFIQERHIPRVSNIRDEHAATADSWRCSIALWALGKQPPPEILP